MNKTYEVCCIEVGLDIHQPPPELEMHWVGYENGIAIPCATKTEALNYSLNECVTTPESKQAHDDYFDERRAKEILATEIFLKSLRLEYFNISNHFYDTVYEEAYRRVPTKNLDEIGAELKIIVDLVKKIVAKPLYML